MTREQIIEMAKEVGFGNYVYEALSAFERFAALVAAAEREACVDIIEAYKIPVGNSAAGEMACEWTYAALHEIRDEIRERSH